MIQGLVSLEIGLLADCWLRLAWREDPEYCLRIDEKIVSRMIIYCVLAGGWIERFCRHESWYCQVSFGILAAYLLVASIQDIQSCEVYDMLHILALPGGIILLADADIGQILSLVFFALLQLGIFMRLYGEADGYAFLVCAMYECRHGSGLITYLLHMAATFLALAVVQGVKRNIARDGNLRKAVPLLPYITGTAVLFL